MALDLIKNYKTDKNKEIEGIWEDFGEGCRILIARMGNPKYVEAFRKISKPHAKAMRRGTLKEEIAERIMNEALAEAIVLGWEGLEENGVEVPYNKENCMRILTTYKDLKDQIQDIAGSMEVFKADQDEEAVGN